MPSLRICIIKLFYAKGTSKIGLAFVDSYRTIDLKEESFWGVQILDAFT